MEDIFQLLFGWVFLELIGAGLRYCYNTIFYVFGFKKYIKFSSYWKAEGSVDKQNDNEMRNSLIGTIFIIFIVALIILFNLLYF